MVVVCPGVVGEGGLCVLLVGGTPVFGAAFGVLGVAVPVPAPAGTQGIGVIALGCCGGVEGTVEGVCGAVDVVGGTGDGFGGTGNWVPCVLGVCPGAGEPGVVEVCPAFCALSAIADSAIANASPLIVVVNCRLMRSVLLEYTVMPIRMHVRCLIY